MCDHPYLVSLLFAVLVSLHPVTFCYYLSYRGLADCFPDGSGDSDIDSLLLAASQQFKGPVENATEIDDLFLEASQNYDLMASEGACAGKPTPPVATSGKGKRSVSNPRYAYPKSNKDVQNVRESAIPKKTNSTPSGLSIEWRIYHRRRSIAGISCVRSLPQ